MMTPDEQLEQLIDSYEWESDIEKEWRLNNEYNEFIGGLNHE